MDRSYTILLVADRGGKMKKIRLEHRVVVGSLVCAALLLATFSGMMAHYFTVVGKVSENELIRNENLELQNKIQEAEAKFEHINGELDRVKRLNVNLRNISKLTDANGKLATAPTEAPTAAVAVSGTDPGEPAQMRAGGAAAGQGGPLHAEPKLKGEQVAASSLGGDGDLLKQLDNLDDKVKAQEQEARALKSYFEDQQALLASAPSIWPVRGWVTSDFAVRMDPYTGEKIMHEGLDVAASVGSPVHAPADGTVVFNGIEGGYGHVLVIDHGYGIKTRYGHLSRIDVKLGERVKRGQLVAAVGNSGRSTGPHLHYEVRVNGVATNPRQFILEE